MYGYVYRTTNLINGKIYIGKHKADKFDPDYKGSGKYLWKAIDRYGWDNFKVEMLCPCFSESEMNAEERFLIKYFNSRAKIGVGYNISEGGDWGDVTQGLTEEDYNLMRIRRSRSLRGKPKSESHKRKISESEKGKLVSDETRKKLRESHLGNTWTEESKAKARATRMNPEHRAKISEICRNRVYPRICVICGKEFQGRSATAKYCTECKKGGNYYE